jgi:hypothetical protein
MRIFYPVYLLLPTGISLFVKLYKNYGNNDANNLHLLHH